MDIFVAATGVGLVMVGNIVAFGYCYGRLTQRVDDIIKRLDRVEKILNSQGCQPQGKAENKPDPS